MLQPSRGLWNVSKPGLRDLAVNALIDAVASGELKTGERLLESDLAHKMGISRAPIREALLILQNTGIVTYVPRKGCCVAPITRQDVEEICSLRTALEGLAARIVARAATEGELAGLEEILEDIEKANTWQEKVERDVELHRAICRLSGHKRLNRMWDNMAIETRIMIANFRAHRLSETVDIAVHRGIVDALKSRDSELAVRRIEEHHEAAKSLFLKVVKEMSAEQEADRTGDSKGVLDAANCGTTKDENECGVNSYRTTR